MKRIIIQLIIIISLLAQCIAVYANDDNIIYYSDETASLPETVGGTWVIEERTPKIYEDNDFSKNSGRLGTVYGTWSVINGKYIQNGLSVGAAARTLLPENFSDFTMEFDVTPLSDDTKLMLFFGCTSLYEVCVGEITSDGSNIIIGENEYKGNGHIEKNIDYKIKLESKLGNLKIYINEEVVNEQTGLVIPEGQIGFGCWNSKAEFDNFKVTAPDKLGGGNKLIQKSAENAVAFADGEIEDGNFTARISADKLSDGECGIVINGNMNKDGYYFGVNKNKAVVRVKNDGIVKTLAETEYKAQSERYYDYTAVVKGNETVFKINNVEVLRINDKTLSNGMSGIYSEKTGICCEYMGYKSEEITYSEEAVLDFNVKCISDIDKRYEEACGVVTGLGIIGVYSDGTFRGNNGLTKGEFADIIYKIQGINPSAGSYSFSISDVREEYLFKNAVYEAVKEVYFKLDGTEFHPEETINFEEAVFAAVKILGMLPLAEMKSTLSVAQQLDLLENVKFENGLLTRNNAAQLILNILQCKRVTPANITGGVLKGERTETFLKDTFGVEKIRGVVEETAYGCADVDKELNLTPKEIRLDGKIITTDTECADLLGRNVVCYAQMDNEEGKSIWIAPYRSEITKITSSMLSDETTKNLIEYFRFEDSSKTVKVKIPKDAKIIYNGQFYTTAEKSQDDIFSIDNGVITLVYNNSDSEPTIIKVDNYVNYVVDTVSLPNGLIYDKYQKSPLDLGNGDDKIIMLKGGKTIGVSEIKKLDILSVLVPKSPYGYTKITVSEAEPVKGTLKAITDNEITIDRDSYSLSKEVDKSKLNLSDYVAVYMDFNNIVVYVTKVTEQDYAYLVKTSYDDENDEIMFKMFTFENGQGIFKAADKVTVYTSSNGKIKYAKKNYRALAVNLGEILDSSKVIDKDGKIKKYGLLIKYKINTENAVYEIRFAANDTNTDVPEEKNEFSCYYDSEQSGETAYYYSGLVNSKYRITPDTKILNLSGDCTNMEGFGMITTGALLWDEYYDCRLYDVNEEFKTAVMVVYDMNPGYNLPVGVVTDVKYVIDEKDNSCLAVTMYKNGALVTEYVINDNLVCDSQAAYWFKNEGTAVKELKAGDIIIYQTNAEGYVTNFKLIFKNKQQDFYATSPRGWYWGTIPSTNMTLAYADIKKKTGDVFVFDSNKYSRPVVKNAAVYFVCERNKVMPASFEDVKAGDKTAMIWKSAELNTVVIYR